MRLFFINANGIFNSPTKLSDIFITAKALEAGVIGIAETNTDWKKEYLKSKFSHTLKTTSKQSVNFTNWTTSKTQFSTSQIPSSSDIQRGGTSMTVVGKWVGRIVDSGNDNRLGRWTWQTLRGDTNLTIITAYRVCQDKGLSGDLTAHAQQSALLLDTSPTPDPRHQVLEDLKIFVTHRRHKGEAIILMIDANEDCISPNSKLRRTMDHLQMTNLHHLLHGEGCPKTYIRGSQQIDHIYGCPRVAQHTINAGILPFKHGIDTDHRGLYVDVEVNNIFRSSTMDLKNIPPRKLSSQNKKHAEALRDTVRKGCINQQIRSKLLTLSNIPTHRWNSSHQKMLDKIDSKFTAIVLSAETKVTHKPYGYPISEKLIQAGQLLRYWKMRLSNSLIATVNLQTNIHHLEDELDISRDIRNSILSPQQIKSSISQSKSKLKSIQKEASKLRDEWLREKAINAAHDNNISVAQAVTNIAVCESSRRIYRHISRDLSSKQRSSVYFIEVPADNKPPRQSEVWKEIREADKIHSHLIKHSEEHYRLAQNTPFGKTDRGFHLGFTGTGHVAHEILQGTYDYKLNELHEEAKQFILNLRRRESPIMSTTITDDEVFNLYTKWNEHTSTSPSQFHLGLYKALIHSSHILSILTMLMNLPLKHGMPLRRWEHSTMCMIEKDIGSPKLHRLRLIHLFEADMNGIAKIIWARRFIYHCQDHNLLHPSQHGGLPGFETQHVLLKFRMTIDSVNTMRHNLAINNNDAEACYDRIIPAVNGVSHLSKGMPLNAIKLQNTILLNMKYSVRTAHGTSEASWKNSATDPKFGLGQGGGWSPPGWASLSSDMINTHEQLAPQGMTIQSVTGSDDSTRRTVDAYVDDANNGVNDGESQDGVQYPILLDQLEKSSQQWERILQITGGNLNLKKCFCSLLTWEWHGECPSPRPIIETPGDIEITNSSTGVSSTITRLNPDQAFKLLGVWVQLYGTMTTHYTTLQEKIRDLTRSLCASNLTHNESMIAYKRVAFKKLEYSLPMTTYTKNELDELQKPFTRTFLSNSGYHSRFPRALVYAPERYGCIGFDNLYQSRGILQIKYLISHIRQRDDLGKSMICVMEQTQLFSGLSTPLLQLPSSLPVTKLKYIPQGWLLTIRNFLVTFNGSIEFPDQWVPSSQRENDSVLMEQIMQRTKSPTALRRINACRLYLRVNTVADISDVTGKVIEEQFILGNCNPCASNLLWPRQFYPPSKCWAAWKTAITATFLTSPSKPFELEQPLGKWTRNPDRIFHTVVDPLTNILYRETDITGTYQKYSPSQSHRRRYNIHTAEPSMLPDIVTPVQYKVHQDQISISTILYRSPPIQPESNNFTIFVSKLPEAYQDLLRNITAPSETLLVNSIQQGVQLVIASDGSKKTSGATYGWILETISKTLLAEGMGPVHGKLTSLTSHRAELYGITAALLYVLQICTFFKLNIVVTIVAYCDNMECVHKINTSLSPMRGTSRYITADYDIESLLRHIIQTQRVTVSAEWVKSHQDDTKEPEELTYNAQLNIAADELAEYAYDSCTPSQEKFPPFPTTIISLRIDGIRVTSKLKNQIEDAIHLESIRTYRSNKYGWDQQTWESIDWYAFEIAIKHQKPGLKRFLHRFTCEWLPVGARTKFYQHNQNAKCVSCNSVHDESCVHIFQCPNQRRRTNLITQVTSLMTLLTKKHTYRPLMKILQQNILQWSKGDPPSDFQLPTHPSTYDYTIQNAVSEQTSIGWNHIFKGWISTKWAIAQDEYYDERCKTDKRINRKYHNKTTWSKTVIHGLHDIAFSTWKFRNKDIYGHNKQEEEQIGLDKMKSKVRREYERRHTFPAKIQWRYFTRTIQDRVNDSVHMLQAWYENLKTALIAMEERPFPATGIG